MTDSLWRRTIELFLLAGRNGNEGLLPALHDMAWTLRISETQLQSDLASLTNLGIVHTDDLNQWHVSNFAKRQAPADVKDRVAQYRDRAKKHGYYEDATSEKPRSNESLPLRYTDTDTELDTDKSKRKKKISEAKPPTPPQIEAYRRAAHRYPNKSLYSLICEHVKDDSTSLDLFEKIVTGWIAMGWNPANINGILEFVDRGEVPHRNGQNGNGRQSEDSAESIKGYKVYR